MKQLSAMGMRRPFFQQHQHQQQHHHNHHHHHPARRMRIDGASGDGGGGVVSPLDAPPFGPEGLSTEVMAELLHMPSLPPQPTPHSTAPPGYQTGLFCIDAQRVSLFEFNFIR